MLVVLDAGHYGKYNQSPVLKSLYESEFNWKMVYYMKNYFEEMGIKVKLTRYSSSIDLPVYNRGLLAKGADVIMLDCLGFNQRHRDLLQKQLDVPVLLSNVLIARLAAELLV